MGKTINEKPSIEFDHFLRIELENIFHKIKSASVYILIYLMQKFNKPFMKTEKISTNILFVDAF